MCKLIRQFIMTSYNVSQRFNTSCAFSNDNMYKYNVGRTNLPVHGTSISYISDKIADADIMFDTTHILYENMEYEDNFTSPSTFSAPVSVVSNDILDTSLLT